MADAFDSAFAELGIDPAWAAGGFTGGNPPPYLSTDPKDRMTGPGFAIGEPAPGTTPASAPQAGQWSANNQGFLDWATKNYGADKNSFVKIPPGQFQQILQRYSQETGNQAKYLGGPSGDQVDFGQGVQDALTSSGQIWNNESTGAGGPGGVIRPPSGPPQGGGAPGGPIPWGGGGGGSGSPGSMTMPTAPGATDLKAPDPFTYQPSTLGNFQSPGNVPQMERLGYNSMSTPTAFQGTRQADPGTLNYSTLATPGGYTPEKYTGLSAEDLKSGPAADAYKWRFDQGQAATENALAHTGALRTGNAARALTEYGQGMASQEYGAADARASATNQMNNATGLGAYQTNAQTGLAYNQNANANALNFGQANIGNQFNANEANYGRASTEAQQGFSNAFNVNQANNQGSNAAIQGNNANALAAQGQQFGQGLAGYQANQAAQNQMYQQALGAYGQNAQTQLAYGSQNQNNQLSNYQAQVNAALGLGNLNLGFQNSAQNYALGQGGLGLQQGQLDLSKSNAQWGQGLDTYDRNYRANVLDPWAQQMDLAHLGNPGAPNTQGNANAQSGLYTDQGNAQAAGTVGAGNQWSNLGSNLGQTGQAAYLEWLKRQPKTNMAGGGGGQLAG